MKQHTRIILLILCTFLLTSCVKGSINLDYQDSQNPKLTLELLLPVSLLSDNDINFDDLKKEIQRNFSSWQLETIDNGNTYTVNLLAPSEINQKLLAFIKQQKQNYQVKISKAVINELLNTSELEDISNYSFTNLKEMGLEVNLKVKMPGMIKETNYGKKSSNLVEINLLDFLLEKDVKEIKISSGTSRNNLSISNLIIIAILIIILTIIIRKSK